MRITAGEAIALVLEFAYDYNEVNSLKNGFNLLAFVNKCKKRNFSLKGISCFFTLESINRTQNTILIKYNEF